MKKKIGLLLASAVVLGTVTSTAYGFVNPLKSYNLYEDTHPSNAIVEDDGTRERVMDEYYSNSLRAPGSAPTSSYTGMNDDSGMNIEIPKRRNDDLRESSRKVFGNPEVPAGWTQGPSFYQNPSFESIKAKYKKSDFAGCLQECISYVRKHPNDTLGFYYLAMCYTKVNDKENAIKAYEKVISLNSNPMIVKYATNGRNCVMGAESEKCYPDVNVPDLIYPYADIATGNLVPVDPQTLVQRNLSNLYNKLSPVAPEEKDANGNPIMKALSEGKDKEVKVNLPFGVQDKKLDEFINAPYGNGLSPELNNQYKQIQLKEIQQTINNGNNDDPEKNFNNLQHIQKFDNQKSDSESMKIAYVSQNDIEQLSKDPEYIKTQKELNDLKMLLGSDTTNDSDDLIDLIPYAGKESAEVIQAMMVKSMMPDFSFVNGNSKNLL